MISRLGLSISKVFYRICPDPFVIVILLTLLTAVLALTFGKFPPADQGWLDRADGELGTGIDPIHHGEHGDHGEETSNSPSPRVPRDLRGSF